MSTFSRKKIKDMADIKKHFSISFFKQKTEDRRLIKC